MITLCFVGGRLKNWFLSHMNSWEGKKNTPVTSAIKLRLISPDTLTTTHFFLAAILFCCFCYSVLDFAQFGEHASFRFTQLNTLTSRRQFVLSSSHLKIHCLRILLCSSLCVPDPNLESLELGSFLSQASGIAPGLEMSVGPPLWSTLKYLDSYWVNLNLAEISFVPRILMTLVIVLLFVWHHQHIEHFIYSIQWNISTSASSNLSGEKFFHRAEVFW